MSTATELLDYYLARKLSGDASGSSQRIYLSSKAGYAAIQQELANTNVGVSAIRPGYTDAGMFHSLDITPPGEASTHRPFNGSGKCSASINCTTVVDHY